MKSSKSEVDYVVFFGADGSAIFSCKADGYHIGMKVHCEVRDIVEAQKICDKLNQSKQTQSMFSEKIQKYPTWVHAFFGDIVDTLSTVDKSQYPDVPYVLEYFKRIVPIGNAGLYQDSNLLITVLTPAEDSIQLEVVNRDVRINFEYKQYLAPYLAPYILAACTEEPSPYLGLNIKAVMRPEPAKCDVRWEFYTDQFYTENGWFVCRASEEPGIVDGWINLLFDIYRAYIHIR